MRLLVTYLFLICVSSAIAQSTSNYWTPISNQAIPEHLEASSLPLQYAAFQLDFAAFRQALESVPMEDLTNQRLAGKQIALPMPDGQLADFTIWEAPVFHPNLAARHPNIRSYRGVNKNDKSMAVRMAISTQGVHLAFSGMDGQIYVDPYATGNTAYYLSYFTRDDKAGHEVPGCGYDPASIVSPDISTPVGQPQASTNSAGGPVELREFRLALGCSGEFAVSYGGTVESVLESFNIAINRLNIIFEQNLATRFQLIDGIEPLIYLDPSDDPYQDGTNGGQMLNEHAINLNLIIGEDNFDLGHVFTGGCSGGLGGIAGGQICTEFKGAGVTCFASGNIIATTVEIMAHEIGHQLSAGHTWNGCPPTAQQYAAGSAWEPGSGSTIMSYSGSCGAENNIQNSSDEYFHGGTIDQMSSYIRNGPATCGSTTATANNLPDVSIPLNDGFFIPVNTPFELDAMASDMDGDDITYCWEQRDTGPFGTLGQPELGAPLFRSYPPRTASDRIFPRINTIIANNSDPKELLPFYSRALNFSCTVRDNNPLIGGVSQAYISFNATEDAGPFLVSFPNQNTSMEVGSFQQITWEVANTDQAPVNCHTVDIYLSLDGGFTYPVLLAENVNNDGDYGVVIPDEVTDMARIKIKGSDNIFFDISNTNFSIVPPSQPGYSLAPSTEELLICPPENEEIVFTTGSLLGFDDQISFSVADLPAGTTAEFSETIIAPGEATTLNIDFSGVTGASAGFFTVTATAPGLDDTERIIAYEIIDTDFSALQLTGPANGTIGEEGTPLFSWTLVDNADFYEIQIARSPTFQPDVLIESITGLTTNTYSSNVQLEKGFPYFWRIRPVNICGPGVYSATFAFHTEIQSCAEFAATDVPILIPSTGLPTITSVINIPTGGNINDLNITNLMGDHDIVKHLDVQLISPSGTSALLFEDFPCNNSLMNIKFDDDAAGPIPCPMNTGGFYNIEDAEGLAKFNGENSTGDWTLRMEVINTFGEGGSLDAWSFEICGNVALNGPVLVNNEPVEVPPGLANSILTNSLLTTDVDNTHEELVYTVVEAPLFGKVTRFNVEVPVGGTFTQQDIDHNLMRYQHDGTEEGTDQFTFTVADGEGGWLGTPVFNILIDVDAVVSTSEITAAQHITLSPNPAADQVQVRFEAAMNNLQLMVYNIQGQRMMERQLSIVNENETVELNTSGLINGLYLVEIRSDEHRLIKKMMIQR